MRVTDPQAIRALAHPLRLDLLEVLATAGPATAARCGRLLGVPQANCSFHLRQLAKYGYVEEAEPGPDRRERQWRVVADRPAIRLDAAGDAVLRRELERVVVDRETEAIRAFTERETPESAEWQGSLGLVSAVLAVTPAEAAELRAQWKALLEPFAARGGDTAPGARHVRYFLAATPLTEAGEDA